MLYYSALSVWIVNMLRVLLLKAMIERVLPAREPGRRKRQAGIALYYLLTLILYEVFGRNALYEAGSFLGLILFSLLYPGSLGKRLWASFVVSCMDMACGLAGVWALALAGGGMAWSSVDLAVQTFLLLLCTVVMRVWPQREGGEESEEEDIVFEKGRARILILIPMVSGVALCVLQCGDFGEIGSLILSVSMLFLELCVFSLYETMAADAKKIREKEIYRQQTYAYQNQLDVIMESQNRIRALRHDSKNHILALKALLQKKDWEEADRYLDAMQDFMGNPKEYASTGNEAVDSLLNYKLQKAGSLLHKVEVNIAIPEKLILQSFDLNVVLGNLLDNAIEAAGRTREKELRLTMKLEKGVLFLDLRNSCQGIADGRVQHLETTKKDRAEHGMGLGNVRRIVEKHHGDMELRSENGYLETDIMMYIKEM